MLVSYAPTEIIPEAVAGDVIVASELASKKIRVNAIAPGMIDTDMTRVLSEDIRNKIIDSIPLKEIGKPEDIANAVAFLASDMSRYITGQILSVDGGMS